MISALDTHETVKSLTAAGFTDAQAEALTAVVKQAVDDRPIEYRNEDRHRRFAAGDGGNEGRARQTGRRGRVCPSSNHLGGAEAIPSRPPVSKRVRREKRRTCARHQGDGPALPDLGEHLKEETTVAIDGAIRA
jgi:hypothetical protein